MEIDTETQGLKQISRDWNSRLRYRKGERRRDWNADGEGHGD